MKSNKLRKEFLKFFQEKGHALLLSASLVPENDSTVLFNTAGMQPLVPYLLGQKHAQGLRLVSCQKCVRTKDIDSVGDDTHLTFFEMLGNWSLGDYWKKESISWSYEFLTQNLKISPSKLAVTCFAGEKNISKDIESAKYWQDLGIPLDRIHFLPRENNWWEPAGETGPCGPDTEIFYWTGSDAPSNDINNPKWVEIWNNVFMAYNKTISDSYEPLEQRNVDTGMGLERTLAILNNFDNVYEIDVFQPIIKQISETSDLPYADKNIKSFRIIADHIKTAVFMLSENIAPSNLDRGYVLRRLVRRAIRYCRFLNNQDTIILKTAQTVIDIYKDIYPELETQKTYIFDQLKQEETKFGHTLEKGLKELEKFSLEQSDDLTDSDYGKKAFYFFESFGLPPELSFEELSLKSINFEDFSKAFQVEFTKHQELSRNNSLGKFKSGLADNESNTIKYHTATHLLLAALRKILGTHVSQKGSNITSERLRFDFSHSEKLTLEQIKEIEDLINLKIKKNLTISMSEMDLNQALAQGAMGVFQSKYDDAVKVYTILDPEEKLGYFSKEICAGPHVSNTELIGNFKIIKEEAVSNGIRRIKATISF
ncbi:MAG: alanine--tRNA ligase [Candidatus Parcubacteria bacterium]|nr:alanine--tRNA ligase [Candidatus Parcubacteria bacterium]